MQAFLLALVCFSHLSYVRSAPSGEFQDVSKDYENVTSVNTTEIATEKTTNLSPPAPKNTTQLESEPPPSSSDVSSSINDLKTTTTPSVSKKDAVIESYDEFSNHSMSIDVGYHSPVDPLAMDSNHVDPTQADSTPLPHESSPEKKTGAAPGDPNTSEFYPGGVFVDTMVIIDQQSEMVQISEGIVPPSQDKAATDNMRALDAKGPDLLQNIMVKFFGQSPDESNGEQNSNKEIVMAKEMSAKRNKETVSDTEISSFVEEEFFPELSPESQKKNAKSHKDKKGDGAKRNNKSNEKKHKKGNKIDDEEEDNDKKDPSHKSKEKRNDEKQFTISIKGSEGDVEFLTSSLYEDEYDEEDDLIEDTSTVDIIFRMEEENKYFKCQITKIEERSIKFGCELTGNKMDMCPFELASGSSDSFEDMSDNNNGEGSDEEEEVEEEDFGEEEVDPRKIISDPSPMRVVQEENIREVVVQIETEEVAYGEQLVEIPASSPPDPVATTISSIANENENPTSFPTSDSYTLTTTLPGEGDPLNPLASMDDQSNKTMETNISDAFIAGVNEGRHSPMNDSLSFKDQIGSTQQPLVPEANNGDFFQSDQVNDSSSTEHRIISSTTISSSYLPNVREEDPVNNEINSSSIKFGKFATLKPSSAQNQRNTSGYTAVNTNSNTTPEFNESFPTQETNQTVEVPT